MSESESEMGGRGRGNKKKTCKSTVAEGEGEREGERGGAREGDEDTTFEAQRMSLYVTLGFFEVTSSSLTGVRTAASFFGENPT